jgi:hypothetical protein
MKNSVKLELEQLPDTMKLELGLGELPRIETNFLLFFGPILGILKIQITAGW